MIDDQRDPIVAYYVTAFRRDVKGGCDVAWALDNVPEEHRDAVRAVLEENDDEYQDYLDKLDGVCDKVLYCYGTSRDMHYAVCVAGFLSLLALLGRSFIRPNTLYRFSLSCIPVELSSNPLGSPQQPYVTINFSNLMLVHLAFAYNTSPS